MICIIPARGGSVRIPRKNIKLFHGKPIIAYSIETAHKSGLFSLVIVTTDDDEIAGISMRLGAAVMWREPDDGTMGTQEVAGKVLKQIPGIDKACVLYATCPLLTPSDLVTGHAALKDNLFAMSVKDPLADAGCYYFGKTSAFINNVPLLSSHTAMVPLKGAIDINTPQDWADAERAFSALKEKP